VCCMDARVQPSAQLPGAGARSHQEARRLLRAVSGARELPVRRLASYRARGPGATGGLVDDSQGAGAAAALLAVREEGCGDCGSGEAPAAGHPEESALADEGGAAGGHEVPYGPPATGCPGVACGRSHMYGGKACPSNTAKFRKGETRACGNGRERESAPAIRASAAVYRSTR
jgi:hypothetical protein